jgi:orotidine-5'-phosphate decarboxylase
MSSGETLNMREDNPIIFALDVGGWEEAERFVEELKERVWGFKIGKELFTWMGPKAVEMVQKKGGKVFLDLKYHDIPSTVAKAAVMATRLGVSMFNLHTLGGAEMMRAAVEASREAAHKGGLPTPIVLGVTVLTSLQEKDLRSVGITQPVEKEVVQLAVLAQQTGLDGVVASPLEITPLRKACGEDLVIVTPGVRPEKGQRHDQARVMTPAEAIKAGADYLVIGRPIKEAPDPRKATQEILQEIRSVR